MPLTDFQRELCETSTSDFTDLRALYVYGNSSPLIEHGQYAYYGKTCGCLITGTLAGSARQAQARRTSIPARAVPRTTSRTGTRRS